MSFSYPTRQTRQPLDAPGRRHYSPLGHATPGRLGFDGRFDDEPNGTVVNLAARTCGEARDGEILVSQRFHAATEDLVETKHLPHLVAKGFLRPVPVFSVVGLKGSVNPTAVES